MPWRIAERGGRFCVVKKGSGAVVACHGSRAKATRQLRALYASESTTAAAWDGALAGAAWDESEHPRDPGGEGGGQFVEKANAASEGGPSVAEGDNVEAMLDDMGAYELEGGVERHPERYHQHPKSGFTVEKPGVVFPEVMPPELDADGWGRKPPRIRDVVHGDNFKKPAGFEDATSLGYDKYQVGDPRPPEFLYRAVSEEEWQQAVERGYIQSDQRMNLTEGEGTVTALDNPLFYFPGNLASDKPGTYEGRIIRIKYRDEDGWRHDRDGYVKTSEKIPISQVDKITPKLKRERTEEDLGTSVVVASYVEAEHPRHEEGSSWGGRWRSKLDDEIIAAVKKTDRGWNNGDAYHMITSPYRRTLSVMQQARAMWRATGGDVRAVMRAMDSGAEWGLGWRVAYDEWDAASQVGGSGSMPRDTADGIARLTKEEGGGYGDRVPLSETDVEAFAARRKWHQDKFRELYPDGVTMYRGVSGKPAAKWTRSAEGSDEFEGPVWQLSSWTTSRGIAGTFAWGENGRGKGIVLEAHITADDIWMLPVYGGEGVLRVHDTKGEAVVLSPDLTRRARVVR